MNEALTFCLAAAALVALVVGTEDARCPSGKRRFPSKGQARRARRGVGNRFRVYLCDDCHGYHITRSVR